MQFWLGEFGLLLAVFILLLLLSMVWPPDSPWSPWWRTNRENAKKLCKLLKVGKKDLIYELGCGDGQVLQEAGKRGAKGIGFEIDPLRVLWTRFLVRRQNLNEKITIKRQNFFTVSLQEATIVYFYLVPRVITDLKPKLLKELKRGTKVVSYVYPVSYLTLLKKDQDFYIYEVS